MKALEDYAISNFMPQEPVSDPQLSPDGSLIAFTYTEVNYDEDQYDSSIWVKELGEKGKRLTYGNADSSPRWSPECKQIAFLSNRSPVEGAKGKQLWLIPVGGGEDRRLTELPWGVRNPLWSPNGDAVYFHSEDDAGETGGAAMSRSSGASTTSTTRGAASTQAAGYTCSRWTWMESGAAHRGRV